ncbi:hypothetical protein HY256_08375 [Candidatus Sumerlaeota bacterium]|nr:hypothetical protein [Candidatus Sumerlaeota bacterium]
MSLVEIGVSPILLIFIPLVIAYFIYYAIVSISLDTGSAGQQPTGLLSLLSIIYDFLLFIPAIGILVFLFRVIGIFAPSGFPYRSISNGQSDVWGEELLLSSLTREDYRDAIFGAGVIHSTRRAAWLTVFLSVGQMVVQVCFGLFMFSRGPGTLTLRNVFAVFPNFLELTLLGGLIFLYLTAMGSFNLILSMRAIASIMNEGAFPGRITEMGYAILRVGIHLPGAILLIASLIFIRSSWRFYTAVVILTTAGVAYALTRDTLSKNRGDYGRAFFTAVRRKYGD